MRNRPPSPEHAEAVSRRLAALSAEMAAARGVPVPEHPPTRIRDGVLGSVAPPASPEPVWVPDPGRHASRRGARLPGWSAGGLRLGPAHLAVVALVSGIAVAFAVWAMVRDAPEPAAAPTVSAVSEPLLPAPTGVAPGGVAPGGATPGGSATDQPASTGASGDVTVDVAGKVRRPGIAVLAPGSRVVDALEAAGGARRGVDLTALNLARPLIDGEQILVGIRAPAGVAGSLGTPGSPAASPPAALVSLNSADQATLETLPGVGPVTATAIIAWREANGGFTAVDELIEVDGIGEATLADLAPLVTL